MDATVNSLLYICETSAAELRELTDRLNTVSPRQAESVLRAIQKTGDVLSSGLVRLNHFVDSIPDEDATPDNKEPFANRGLLLAATYLGDASTRGICPKCGGICRVQ
tara:strand:- start:333 stop:653 length:321 start_codon:yes stop_codon:yes gene_type:complete